MDSTANILHAKNSLVEWRTHLKTWSCVFTWNTCIYIPFIHIFVSILDPIGSNVLHWSVHPQFWECKDSIQYCKGPSSATYFFLWQQRLEPTTFSWELWQIAAGLLLFDLQFVTSQKEWNRHYKDLKSSTDLNSTLGWSGSSQLQIRNQFLTSAVSPIYFSDTFGS